MDHQVNIYQFGGYWEKFRSCVLMIRVRLKIIRKGISKVTNGSGIKRILDCLV